MTKEKLKAKRGITLIALVITIIVMLILVAATVTVALNGGLFKTAKQAAKDTQIATVREMVNTDVLAERSTKKGRDITQEELGSILGRYCDDVPSLEDIESEEELGNVELKLKKEYGGHDTTLKELYNGQTQLAEWEEKKDEEGNITITKGKKTLNIGDYVEYTTEASPSTKWRVLGVEDGKILLVADTNVLDENEAELQVTLSGSDWGEDGQPLVKQLNEACQTYLNTEYAESIRSLTVEDINNITGYNPLYTEKKNPTQEDIENDTNHSYRCWSGETREYGNKVKYTWSLTSPRRVVYDDTGEGGNGKHKEVTSEWTTFIMPGGVQLGDQGLVVESTTYDYTPTNLNYTGAGGVLGIPNSSPAFDMLFYPQFNVNFKYWLGSTYVSTSKGVVDWGMRIVMNGSAITTSSLWVSRGDTYSVSRGIRPVVSLKSDVKLTLDEGVAAKNGSVTYKIDI